MQRHNDSASHCVLTCPSTNHEAQTDKYYSRNKKGTTLSTWHTNPSLLSHKAKLRGWRDFVWGVRSVERSQGSGGQLPHWYVNRHPTFCLGLLWDLTAITSKPIRSWLVTSQVTMSWAPSVAVKTGLNPKTRCRTVLLGDFFPILFRVFWVFTLFFFPHRLAGDELIASNCTRQFWKHRLSRGRATLS